MIFAIVLRGLLFSSLWWVLAEASADGWGLGALAVVASTLTSLWLLPPPSPNHKPRLVASALPAFIAFFLWNSIRGGLQVARLALRPRLDFAPMMLELSLALPPGAARVLMLNTLGLMPGTVGVRLDDARLRVHVLDARLPVAEEARKLETLIARLFGVAA
jgi:multicomponent Na+:H+ antiporter subunit E